jgi:peptide/nickel transport system permease protein
MMKQYIVRRLLLAMVTLFGVSLLIFFIMRAIPGDVAVSILGEGANEQTVAELHQHLGLDDPWYLQYGRWVQDMTHGDMGR